MQAACFNGCKIPPTEPGGRSLWETVLSGWDVFGYKTHADGGSRKWFKVSGNVPGLRDAGRVWAADCDEFLMSKGFVQSVVNRRVLIKQLSPVAGEKRFVIGVYVDDYWTYCEDDAAYDDFFAK